MFELLLAFLGGFICCFAGLYLMSRGKAIKQSDLNSIVKTGETIVPVLKRS